MLPKNREFLEFDDFFSQKKLLSIVDWIVTRTTLAQNPLKLHKVHILFLICCKYEKTRNQIIKSCFFLARIIKFLKIGNFWVPKTSILLKNREFSVSQKHPCCLKIGNLWNPITYAIPEFKQKSVYNMLLDNKIDYYRPPLTVLLKPTASNNQLCKSSCIKACLQTSN